MQRHGTKVQYNTLGVVTANERAHHTCVDTTRNRQENKIKQTPMLENGTAHWCFGLHDCKQPVLSPPHPHSQRYIIPGTCSVPNNIPTTANDRRTPSSFIKNTKTPHLLDRHVRRKSSLQPACDTPIARAMRCTRHTAQHARHIIFQPSGGRGKIKLKLTTLSRTFIHAVSI